MGVCVNRFVVSFVVVAVHLMAAVDAHAQEATKPYAIQVVDEETGRGVPLVELRTVNAMRFVTDSNGYAAIQEPAFHNNFVFFHVFSHGYEFPKEKYGYTGVSLYVTPGGETTLRLKRKNIAERLYRLTGANIYRDSVILGKPTPLKKPLLNANVVGCDTVINAVYRGKIFWAWGDTEQISHPIGNFDTPGAFSLLPSAGGLDPDVGVDFDYFMRPNYPFAKAIAKMPGDGPSWIDGLITVPDEAGDERLVAFYAKASGFTDIYKRGMAIFDDAREEFDHVVELDMNGPIVLSGHPTKAKFDGVEYVVTGKPFQLMRAPANAKDIFDVSQHEAFTCLLEGSTVDDPKIDRTADGTIRYSWRRGVAPLFQNQQKKLALKLVLKPEDNWIQLQDRDTGKSIYSTNGSIYFNEHRNRWVGILSEAFGDPSYLGEVWYSEADSPMGPWTYAVKIITHENYTFYNPKHHPMFDKDGGRIIYFEGTYVNYFTDNQVITPNYNYNQIMYKLNLDDPRLAIPIPIYQLSEGAPTRLGDKQRVDTSRDRHIAFYALDREVEGAIPIYETPVGRKTRLTAELPARRARNAKPLFYAMPADAKPTETMRPLYEYVNFTTAERAYSTNANASFPGFKRSEKPLCLVWNNPYRVAWRFHESS